MIHIYVFIFLLLIIFIILFTIIFKKNEYKESFITDTTSTTKINELNLLENSSFQNGKNISEFNKKSGNADIIVFPNPGISEYVLRQSKNDKISFRTPIFYEIKKTIKCNRIYCIKCLYYSTNDLPLIHRIQYKDLDNNSIFLKSLNDCKKDKNFENKYCLFKTPGNDFDSIEIFISLMYNLNNIKGYNYLTDIILEEVIDGFNLPIIANLRCYLNVFHPKSVESSSSNLIKDISGNNFNFTVSKTNSVQKNNIDLSNNILTGPNSFVLQNFGRNPPIYKSSFTIFLLIKGLSLESGLTESLALSSKSASESTAASSAASTAASAGASAAPSLKDDSKEDDRFFKKSNEDDFDDDGLIKRTFGITILKITGNQNTSLELVIPEKYGYVYMVGAGEIMRSEVQIFSSMENLFTIAYKPDTAMHLYLNGELIIRKKCPKIYFNNPPVMINPFGNFTGNFYLFLYYWKYMVQKDVLELTKYFLKMNACQQNLENPLLKNNLEDFILNNNISEEEEIIFKNKNEFNELEKEKEQELNQTCPKVIYENEHYHVIIPHASKLANEIGYSGIRDYGMDIDNAKKIFEINFPKCKIPDILDKTKYKPKLDSCPFIMLKPENPCYQYECRNTDWTKGIPDNSYCKRSIDVYCSKYSDIDPACYCWKNENKDKSECLKWRGNFEAEDKCDFRKFSIEKHPDSKDYIKKSNIPCWGCNLDAPEPTKSNCEYLDRKGSGAR
jgi:hypothetical protein